MGSISGEETDISESEIKHYVERPYEQLKAGKYLVKNPNATYRCPFCAGKKKQEYRFSELLQHASGVCSGSSNRSGQQKAKHLALAKFLKEDLGKESSSTHSKIEPRIVAEQPKQDELFVWPWKGIVTNILRRPKHEIDVDESAYWLQKFSRYKPVEVHVIWNEEKRTGSAVLSFSKEWKGFSHVMELETDFAANQHGKKDWDTWRRHPGSDLYGWCAQAEDYKSEGPVGDYLREKAELDTCSNINARTMEETNTVVVNLATELSIVNNDLAEMQYKYNEKNMSLSKVSEEFKRLHLAHNEEMEMLQHLAQEHACRIVQEIEYMSCELDRKREELDRWSKELSQEETLTIWERRKFEEQKKRKNESLRLASATQIEADGRVLRLLEEQQRDKKDALETILQLEKEQDEKQKLQLEIEELKGKLKVQECMRGDNDKGAEKKIHEMQEKLNEKIEELNYIESLNQTLTEKDRENNDDLQAARQEMIAGLKGRLGRGTNIVIKNMGELNVKQFQEACKKRYPRGKALKKAALLCNEWQEHIKDSKWYPFKVIEIEGKDNKEIVNEEDEKLKRLRKQWGEGVCAAVVTSLEEMIEYNPTGRNIVPELWNAKKNRKATLKEAIAYIQQRIPKKRRR